MACRVLYGGGYRITYAYGGSHKGVDIIGGNGGLDTVVAHSAGTVEWLQTGYGNNQGSAGNASYGNLVKLRHSGGSCTLYAHLSRVNVGANQRVGKGQPIGYMGNTGNSYGAHLHFEVYNKAGSRINATPYLNNDLPNLKGGGATNTGKEDMGGTTSGGSSSSPKQEKPQRLEITDIKVVSVQGNESGRQGSHLSGFAPPSSGAQILIQRGNTVLEPVLVDTVSLEWVKAGAPGCLEFTCLLDKALQVEMGDAVSFRYKGEKIFYGYVFTKSQQDTHRLSLVCYDQLRYFKNTMSLAYAGKKYADLLRELAAQNKLTCGNIVDTGYVIPRRMEEGTVFDILANASAETLASTGKEFILYDQHGSLCLENPEALFVPIQIDEGAAGQFTYQSSIDRNVYTKAVLARENTETGLRELYVANNEEMQRKWGVLTTYKAQNDLEPAVLPANVKQLLERSSKQTRSLRVGQCLGDVRVRGGASLIMRITLNDKTLNHLMVVERVKHSFTAASHTMALDLSGINGEFTI